MNGCRIKQWQTRPIPGGWGFNYVEDGHAWRINGPTPQRVVDQIVQIQTVNGTFKSESAVWDLCNQKWGEKEPNRLLPGGRPAERIGPTKPSLVPVRSHWEHGPEKFGPILWFWLHSFGMKFNAEDWKMSLERVGYLLDPEFSPGNGCERCYSEWKVIMATEKPLEVTNEEQAAKWTWNVHNRINKKLGYKQFPFATAAKMYGWKVEL